MKRCPTCNHPIGRTPRQNSSGHLWFGMLADALNDSGYTVNSTEVLRLPVSWTGENIKEFLFRPIMKALYPDKKSTTELTKTEWSQVVEELNKALGERVGVHVPYPSEEKDMEQ